MRAFIVLLSIVLISSCKETYKTLPRIGNHEVVNGDTIFHKIPSFEFIDQDSNKVTNKDLSEYIYVSDFFFTHCPSICPKVKRQLLRIHDRYDKEPRLKIVSHTMDPKRDTPSRLKFFAENLEVNTDRWIFLTGDKDELLDMSSSYFIAAYEDDEAPGGFDHSGKIVLIDKDGHVRAFAEGTEHDEVTDFFDDIENLLHEVGGD